MTSVTAFSQPSSDDTAKQNLGQAVKSALSFVTARPALLALLFFQASGLFAVGMIQVTRFPLFIYLSPIVMHALGAYDSADLELRGRCHIGSHSYRFGHRRHLWKLSPRVRA